MTRPPSPSLGSTDDEGLGLPLVPVGASSPSALESLRQDLARALHRFGFVGVVSMEGSEVVVRSPRGELRREVPPWATNLERLPPSERDALVLPLARSVAEEARASLPPSRGRGPRRSALPLLRGAAALLGAGVLGLWGLGRLDGPREPDDAAVSTGAPLGPRDLCRREAEALRGGAALEATTLTEFIPELEVVSFAKGDPLDAHPAFLRHFSRTVDGFRWKEDGLLENLSTNVRAERREWSSPATPARALRVAFDRRTSPHLLTRGRNAPVLERLGALAVDLEASVAVLYGRCEDADEPCFLSWVYGADAASAETAWLYYLGALGPMPLVAPPFLHPPSERALNPAFAFSRLLERVRVRTDGALGSTPGSPFEEASTPLGRLLLPKGSPRETRLALRERLVALGVAPKAP